jgi:hypothetical protein
MNRKNSLTKDRFLDKVKQMIMRMNFSGMTIIRTSPSMMKRTIRTRKRITLLSFLMRFFLRSLVVVIRILVRLEGLDLVPGPILDLLEKRMVIRDPGLVPGPILDLLEKRMVIRDPGLVPGPILDLLEKRIVIRGPGLVLGRILLVATRGIGLPLGPIRGLVLDDVIVVTLDLDIIEGTGHIHLPLLGVGVLEAVDINLGLGPPILLNQSLRRMIPNSR